MITQQIRLPETFSTAIRVAIHFRREAARAHRRPGDLQSRAYKQHDYFLRLLNWVYSDLPRFLPTKVVPEPQTVNNFVHLRFEVSSDEVDVSVNEMQEVHHEIELQIPKELTSKTLLGVDYITQTSDLLSKVRIAMDYARSLCQQLHIGELDNTSASSPVAIIYSELNAECSESAMLSDKWTNIDSWFTRETLEESGLEEYYEDLRLTTLMRPLLKGILSNAKGAEIDDSLQFQPLNSNPFSKEDNDSPQSSTTNKSSILSILTSTAALEAFRKYSANADLTIDDISAAWVDVSKLLHSRVHAISHLSEALTSLAQRRVWAKTNRHSAMLVENPMIADLYDFLVHDKTISTISVLIEMGLFQIYHREAFEVDYLVGKALVNSYSEQLANLQAQIQYIEASSTSLARSLPYGRSKIIRHSPLTRVT